MTDQVLTRLKGRDICYEDWMGLVHLCRGFRTRNRKPVHWTLCHMDASADEVRPRARHQAVTCPECLEVACQPARRILAAFNPSRRAAVGGLPFEPDRD